ncbi:hypothetical protein BR93DRAFT_738322 [Coniochaeta sp. PMI_546]|nr:hypothetical protein BR93DRAFT_738322 [Coniochaeta sp. PMI_546]
MRPCQALQLLVAFAFTFEATSTHSLVSASIVGSHLKLCRLGTTCFDRPYIQIICLFSRTPLTQCVVLLLPTETSASSQLHTGLRKYTLLLGPTWVSSIRAK